MNVNRLIKNLLILLLLTVNTTLFSQIENLIEQNILPTELEENSGIIFYGNKLITHNDSEGQAELYELDIDTNQITRTISITNATNIDWEDITQDNNYIYIGDFGNNYGDRTDLKIYKIAKTDYDENNEVTATIINFSYEDQTDFSNNSETNFDAEAMTVFGNNIHIFTKNRGDFKTKQYAIPNTEGTHSATLLKTYDVQGLVTGASYNPAYSSVFLIGYSYYLDPFIIILNEMESDFTFNNFSKNDLTPIIDKNQTEGICLVSDTYFYISSEKFTYNTTTFDQKLFSFDYNPSVNSVESKIKLDASIYPNPVKNELFIKNISLNSELFIYNSNGIIIDEEKLNSTSYTWKRNPNIINGIYFIKIVSNNKSITKKIFLK